MQVMKTVRLALLLTAVGGIAVARAQDGHDHAGHDHAAPHGGTLAMSGTHHFEVAFAKAGLWVYPLTADHKPVDASKLSGTATFFHPNAPDKPWFAMPIRPVAAPAGQAPTALGLGVDMTKFPATGVKVAFALSNLSDPAAPAASFTVPVAMPMATATPAAGAAAITVTKATQADQAAINKQKVCPVSHEDLTSMGGPLKVSRGNQSVLVCCQGCVKNIQANPDRFLAARP